MAGELLVRTYSAARYAEALPIIDEIASTRTLSSASLRLIRIALETRLPAPEHLGEGAKHLRRIVRNETLEPRVFLSPQSHLDALTAFVLLYCFENAGGFDLVTGRGDDWLVLEAGVVHLYDADWFQQLLDGELELAPPLPVPSESPSFLLAPTALGDLQKQLEIVLRTPEIEDGARAELESLNLLAQRASGRPAAGLAFTTLL